VAKPSKPLVSVSASVRNRRAYFDCRFGQLHVRTAFPTTGGFDEGVTLFCLHPGDGSSRSFARFLPEIAAARSVYAPDLPGFGESDAAPSSSVGDAALAVADLAADLRLRQIDVLGFDFGAGAALQLVAAQPQLVRRLVLVGSPPVEPMPVIRVPSLVIKLRLGMPDRSEYLTRGLPGATLLDLDDYTADLFEAAPSTVAKHVAAFLDKPS